MNMEESNSWVLKFLPNTTGRCPTLKYVGLSAHRRGAELLSRFLLSAFCLLLSAFFYINHNKFTILIVKQKIKINIE